ncbi:MAG: hypothetical protein LBG83_07610 [Oscillospiraceae bacterium]|jgi:riboflavin transporter FmnP|nr:hypothetical protein [Oscillospiraceae bacterium]
MNTKIKRLALCGVFAGLTLALMWIGSFVPSMEYALPAIAGLPALLLVLEAGRPWALAVYAAAAALCLLLLPEKSAALFYAAFFGYYPVLKSFLEEKLPPWLEWPLKFAVFNATAIFAYWLGTKLFGVALDDFGETFGKYAKGILLAMANLSFWLYDYMILSSFITLYRRRWRKKLRHISRL